jgi:hypothetical protein
MAGNHTTYRCMKKLLYVCEADSGGIMEYAIRQTAALARAGVEGCFFVQAIISNREVGGRGESRKAEMLKN